MKFSSLLFGIISVQAVFAEIRPDLIELPAGFKIEIYAEGAENARQMARAEKGTVFAGTRRAGKLWAVTPDGDQMADRALVLEVQPDGAVLNKQVFASGWLQGQEAWGRPNDVLVMPDGALLVSDDASGVIYRISYNQ